MAGREPGGLDVRNVVQIDAGNCKRLQIVNRRDLMLDEMPQGRVLPLEEPRDERSETAGFFLQTAYMLQVIDAMLEILAYAEHHGGRGPQTKLMGCTVNSDPFVGAALQPRDP